MAVATIRSSEPATGEGRFIARSGTLRAAGRTMGEALDALASWGEVGETVPVIIQRVGPDQFFSQAQFDRLTDLQSRIGRLTPVEQRELEELIDAELDASVARLDYFSDQTSSHNSR